MEEEDDVTEVYRPLQEPPQRISKEERTDEPEDAPVLGEAAALVEAAAPIVAGVEFGEERATDGNSPCASDTELGFSESAGADELKEPGGVQKLAQMVTSEGLDKIHTHCETRAVEGGNSPELQPEVKGADAVETSMETLEEGGEAAKLHVDVSGAEISVHEMVRGSVADEGGDSEELVGNDARAEEMKGHEINNSEMMDERASLELRMEGANDRLHILFDDKDSTSHEKEKVAVELLTEVMKSDERAVAMEMVNEMSVSMMDEGVALELQVKTVEKDVVMVYTPLEEIDTIVSYSSQRVDESEITAETQINSAEADTEMVDEINASLEQSHVISGIRKTQESGEGLTPLGFQMNNAEADIAMVRDKSSLAKEVDVMDGINESQQVEHHVGNSESMMLVGSAKATASLSHYEGRVHKDVEKEGEPERVCHKGDAAKALDAEDAGLAQEVEKEDEKSHTDKVQQVDSLVGDTRDMSIPDHDKSTTSNPQNENTEKAWSVKLDEMKATGDEVETNHSLPLGTAIADEMTVPHPGEEEMSDSIRQQETEMIGDKEGVLTVRCQEVVTNHLHAGDKEGEVDVKEAEGMMEADGAMLHEMDAPQSHKSPRSVAGEQEDKASLSVTATGAAAEETMEDAFMTSVEEELSASVNAPTRGGGRKKRGRPPRVQSSRPLTKKREEEDVCFICFDGGNLVVCDRRGCPKVYHPSCVNRDEAFFRAKGRWNCGWHICSICQKAAHYMCYTCTYSLCKSCIKETEFACVRGNKGLCETCKSTVMLIETNEQSNQKMVNFDDKSSWEYLFKDYWLDQKSKLSITLDEILNAKKPSKRLGSRTGESSDEAYEANDAVVASSSDSSSGRHEGGHSSKKKQKRRSRIRSSEESSMHVMDSVGSSLSEEGGWASKELLEFVSHMRDGDTSLLSQFDVQALLLEYIKRNNLRDPRRKSQIICDSRLESLFGKTRVGHFEMLKLLESHFLIKENSQVITDENQAVTVDLDSGQIDVEGSSDAATKRRKSRKKEVRGLQSNLDDYAAIDVHNINLLYLRRNLMEDLLDDAENFSQKVVDCFVRIRISGAAQKQDMYRIVQVVGTTKVAENYKTGKKMTDIALEILNLNKTEAIPIDTISNQEFTEEECKRLRQSIKCGFIRPLTVRDVQEKAISLQAIRVNDWLESEKSRLGHLRDRASEKGRRKELRECVEKLQLLNTPEERLRRLNEIPEVYVDPKMDPDYESAEEEQPGDNKREHYSRQRDSGLSRKGRDQSSGKNLGSIDNWNSSRTASAITLEASRSVARDGSTYGDRTHEPLRNHPGRDMFLTNNVETPSKMTNVTNLQSASWNNSPVTTAAAVQSSLLLSTGAGDGTASSINESEKIWHYQDPAGKIQGPFSITQLRKWNSTGYFPRDLRIWKTTEKQEDSILLTDALLGKFHKDWESQKSSVPHPPNVMHLNVTRQNVKEVGWRGNNFSASSNFEQASAQSQARNSQTTALSFSGRQYQASHYPARDMTASNASRWQGLQEQDSNRNQFSGDHRKGPLVMDSYNSPGSTKPVNGGCTDRPLAAGINQFSHTPFEAGQIVSSWSDQSHGALVGVGVHSNQVSSVVKTVHTAEGLHDGQQIVSHRSDDIIAFGKQSVIGVSGDDGSKIKISESIPQTENYQSLISPSPAPKNPLKALDSPGLDKSKSMASQERTIPSDNMEDRAHGTKLQQSVSLHGPTGGSSMQTSSTNVLDASPPKNTYLSNASATALSGSVPVHVPSEHEKTNQFQRPEAVLPTLQPVPPSNWSGSEVTKGSEWSMPSPTPSTDTARVDVAARGASFHNHPVFSDSSRLPAASAQWQANTTAESGPSSMTDQTMGTRGDQDPSQRFASENASASGVVTTSTQNTGWGTGTPGNANINWGTAQASGNPGWVNPGPGNANVNINWTPAGQGVAAAQTVWHGPVQGNNINANAAWGAPLQGNLTPTANWAATVLMNANLSANWGSAAQGHSNPTGGWGGSAQGAPVHGNANQSATWGMPGQVNPNAGWGVGSGSMNMGWNASTGNSNNWGGPQRDNDSGNGSARNRVHSVNTGSNRSAQGQRGGVCKYHESGHCKKGSSCNYLHT